MPEQCRHPALLPGQSFEGRSKTPASGPGSLGDYEKKDGTMRVQTMAAIALAVLRLVTPASAEDFSRVGRRYPIRLELA